MRLRALSVGILLLIALGASACHAAPAAVKPIAPPVDVKARDLQVQVDRLHTLVDVISPPVDPEPLRDVSNGRYMALVDHITSDAGAQRVVLDFVSEGSVPHTDSHVWNKIKHVQSIRVAHDVSLEVPVESGPDTMIAPGELAARWKAQPYLSGTPFYVFLSDGEVTAMWPVPFP